MNRLFLGLILLITLQSARCVQEPMAVAEETGTIPDKALAVTAGNFDSLASLNTISLVEFYSAHCQVCAGMVWAIDSLASTFSDSALIGACNTEIDTLWKRFAVQSVPTYIFFKSGVEVTRRSFTLNAPAAYDTLAALMAGLLAGAVTPPDSTPTNYLTLDTTSFDTTVLRMGRVALVFFFNPSEAPCIHMDSVVKAIAPRYNDSAVIAKVDASDQLSLAVRYYVNYVPRLLFFKDSLLVEEHNGMISADSLRAILDRLVAPTVQPVALNLSNFDAVIKVPDLIAMVDFFSPLCGSCQAMNPVVATLAGRFEGRALVGKVNIDEEDSLKTIFNITRWPAFVFFKDGTEYQRVIGVVPEDSLAGVVEKILSGGM
jgi:thioredoxin 1